MSPTLLVGGAGLIVVGILSGGLYIVGEKLLDARDTIGEQKAEIAGYRAVEKQRAKDDDLSIKIANVKTQVDEAIRSAVFPARETIINVPSDKVCPKGDPALAAAAVGVLDLRSRYLSARGLEAPAVGGPPAAVPAARRFGPRQP